MSLPPLMLPTHTQSFIRGDVIIHPSVAIASGAILQAGPNSRIIIAAGVCIGMGVVLHAYQGTLEIEEGVSLGAGALVVGQGKIGANACIGAAATILNSSIEQGKIVPPGSLLGDTSRQIDQLQVTDTITLPDATSAVEEPETAGAILEIQPLAAIEGQPSQVAGINVYGQMYVNQLMVKLLPNRQALNSDPVPSTSKNPWDE